MLFIKLVWESLLMAFHSVTVNKLRTILTLLGITIGIFTIISVFTVVNSLESNIRENIASLGDNVIYVQKWPWSFENDYAWWEYIKRPTPKYSEYEDIARKSSLVDAAAFSVSAQRLVKYGNNSAEATLWANSYQFQEIRSFEVESGRYFSMFESNSGRNVALIGKKLASKLFDKADPLGKDIKIMGRKTQVIGVIKKEGTGLGGSLDEVVLLPINFARNIFDIKSDELNPMIMVKAKPNVPVEQLKDELKMILRNKRALKPMQKDNFALNQSSIISKGLDSIFAVLNTVGWIIGGFSILVGGFGIANIMFVSVKERTSQIGIQKALGAKKFFILLEYLYEATLLALAGGAIGLLLVFGCTVLINHLTDFTITLTLANIIKGLLISCTIGVIAGFTPAWSAAKLNPVEAINTTF